MNKYMAAFIFLVLVVSGCTVVDRNTGETSDSTSDDSSLDSDTSTSTTSTSSSSSSSIYSDVICFLYPPSCLGSVDTTDDDGIPAISDGTVNTVEYALARPSIKQSALNQDPGDDITTRWVVKNDGDETIYTALFLINGSQIDGTQGGKIYLDSNYNSFSEKVDYPGVLISNDFFYHQYAPVSRSMTRTAKVVFDIPHCSLGQFNAPVFVLYKHDIRSSIMLTLADFDWWEELNNQEQDSKIMPQKSLSIFGPFSLSIYPDNNFQPIIISDGEKFGINFKLSNNDNGRASINKFDIYISDKLIPQDMGTSRCDLEANLSATPPSGMNAYTLKQTLLDKMNSVDISYDDGFKGSEEYDCSFIYNPIYFETDFEKGGSVQRYISLYVEYTYVYNGMFTLSTINDTGYSAC